VLASIQDALAKKEKVSIAGFGVFETVHRPARDGRNPQTGETIKIAASNAVKFKPGKSLRDAVND
jgi:nucleoid DNA-binding protein